MPDTEMWGAQNVLKRFFEERQAAFMAFDPSFDATFLAAWKNALDDTAFDTMGDDQQVYEGIILLDEIKSPMDRCRDKYREVKYYAGKAFPGNSEVMREFGERKYSQVSASHLKMVKFMEEMHGVAEKYKTDIIAKGYTQSAIDQIATLATELHDDNLAQQLKKKERPSATRQRIEKLNELYAFGQAVAEVAPLVFRDSPAHQKMFRLGIGNRKRAKEKRWIALEPKSQRKVGLKKLQKATGKINLVNQGTGSVEFWTGNKVQETPAHVTTLTAGERQELEIKKISDRFLFLRSAAAKKVRVMLEWVEQKK